MGSRSRITRCGESVACSFQVVRSAMTSYETSVVMRLWMLVVRFLRRKGFQESVAEDIASAMRVSMIERHSQFLQGGYPSKLPRCLSREALSRASVALKRSQRVKNLDPHDMDMTLNFEANAAKASFLRVRKRDTTASGCFSARQRSRNWRSALPPAAARNRGSLIWPDRLA